MSNHWTILPAFYLFVVTGVTLIPFCNRDNFNNLDFVEIHTYNSTFVKLLFHLKICKILVNMALIFGDCACWFKW